LQSLDSWQRGSGCIPIYNLLGEGATADTCRARVWLWVKHGASVANGKTVTKALAKQAVQERATALSGEGQWQKAARPLET